jgi:hypothetical protein
MPTTKQLLDSPYGLFVPGGEADDARRRALWEAVAGACESIYWVGPLSEKPVLPGPIRARLLECPLEARADGVREVLRHDPHAVHAVGAADDALLRIMAQAALVGCVAVVELPEISVEAILGRLRGAIEEVVFNASLREIDVGGAVWRPPVA